MNAVEPYQDGLSTGESGGRLGRSAKQSDGQESSNHIVRERFLPAIGDPEVEARKASRHTGTTR